MTAGRILFAWMMGACWVLAGGLLLLAGWSMESCVIAGLGSIAVGLLVAAVPVRPVAEVSGVVTLPCISLAVLVGILDPSAAILSVIAVTLYAAIASVSTAVCLTESGIWPASPT